MYMHTFSVVLPDPDDPNIVSWHLTQSEDGKRDRVLIGDVTNRILMIDVASNCESPPPLQFVVQWSDRSGMLRQPMRFSMSKTWYTMPSRVLEGTIVRRTKVRILQ